jgi:DNA modification methylase
VLDPFFGTGTVASVAREHGRDWLGIELNPDYIPLAEQRLGIPIRRA